MLALIPAILLGVVLWTFAGPIPAVVFALGIFGALGLVRFALEEPPRRPRPPLPR